jgi:hypothetical protein
MSEFNEGVKYYTHRETSWPPEPKSSITNTITRADLTTLLDKVSIIETSKLGYRYGQCLYNELSKLHPATASEINGTDLDPFHIDSRVPNLLILLVKGMPNA